MIFLAQILVIALKFIVPLLMFPFPFLSVWLNYFLDVIDGDILLTLGVSDYTYQSIDKAADYFSYIIMLIVAWKWRIRNTVLVLFIYRSIGQILFFINRNELMFFYFQNFLEPLMMIYTLILFRQKTDQKAFLWYKKHLILIWGVIIIYKVWNEWYLHFANIDLSMLFFGFSG